MKLRLLSAICVLIFSHLLSLSANGASVLDQANDDLSTAGGAAAISFTGEDGTTQSLAQTFTVGIGGLLTQVDLAINAWSDAASDLILHILPASGQQVDFSAGPLFSKVIPISAIPRVHNSVPSEFVSFDISAARIFVSPGDEFAIGLTRDPASPEQPSSSGLNWVTWRWNDQVLYSNGAPWLDPDGGTNFSVPCCSASVPSDFLFRTFVDPDAVVSISPVIGIEPDGTEQECSQHGGTIVQLTAEIEVGNIASATWTIDGVPAGETQTITSPLLELGQHSVQVDVVADDGATGSATETISVVDTLPPQIEAAFVDAKTGQIINQVLNGMRILPSILVTDICDSDPSIDTTVGFPAEHGDTLMVNRIGRGLLINAESQPSQLDLSVIAADASGNNATEKAVVELVK